MDTQVAPRERSFFGSKLNFSSSSSECIPDGSNMTDIEGKMKNKFLSIWNNVKYGMKLKTNFSKDYPVWLLGSCYRKLENPGSDVAEVGTDIAAFQSQSDVMNSEDGLEGFKKDFSSRLWLTYRREFPILNGSNYSSDCGWGCMLRSGQMLIAQALIMHFLGRDWRWTPDQPEISIMHRKIIKWFGDKPSRNSPLSLHSLVSLGEALGKKAGDWYGPGFVAHLFRQAFKRASEDNYEFDALTVCVAQNCTVYIKNILEDCEVGDKWKSLILLVPARLGVEKFNAMYAPCLTALFSIKQCIGIIGGRPKHSLYFVGYQEDKLIHLDPHYCQEVVDVWSPQFPLNTFHCRSPRKLHISKIDPSCCIGFYCSTKEDFFTLIETVQPILNPPSGEGEYPMFTFCDAYSCDAEFIAKEYPPTEYEYSLSSNEPDDLETEAFELV